MKKSLSFILSCLLTFIALFVFMPYNFAVSEETNLLTNGDFSDVNEETGTFGDSVFTLKKWNPQNVSVLRSNVDNSNNYYVTAVSKNNILMLIQGSLNLSAGSYRVMFDAKIANGTCSVCVEMKSGGIKIAATGGNIGNLSDFTEVYYDFELDNNGVYEFNFIVSEMTKKINVDNIALYYLSGNSEEPSEEETTTLITTETGASLRTVKNSAGLRFRGRVDKKLFDGYVETYGSANVKAGIMIAPTDFLTDCEFTYEALSVSKAVQVCVAEAWNNGGTAEQDGYYGFNCAFVNIYPYNMDRKFSFRSFVRYVENDNMTYVYGEYSEENNVRSFYEVALAASEHLSEYEDYQQEAIEHFCGLIEYPASENVADGNDYSLTFTGVKGYFVLDYDRAAYSLSDVKISVGDETPRNFSGMEYLSESANITITFTVEAENPPLTCPVRGKVYKTI